MKHAPLMGHVTPLPPRAAEEETEEPVSEALLYLAKIYLAFAFVAIVLFFIVRAIESRHETSSLHIEVAYRVPVELPEEES